MSTPLRAIANALHGDGADEVGLDQSKPSASVVYVTPEMAERWLGKNVHNRRLKTAKIQEFARDMAAGRWQITGEAVKFDTRGNLLDGQNRLHAVIASGSTVPMFVVRGLAPDSQEVMDTGSPRSRADALHLRDYPNSHDLAAAINVWYGWTSGFYKSAVHQSNVKLTNSEVLVIAEAHPGLSTAASRSGSIYRSLKLPRGAIATALYTLEQIDADDANEFFGRIVDLKTDGKGDPINTLLKRVGETRDVKTRIWVSTAIYFLFRSWNACRSRERLEKFQLGSPMRGYVSIPEPK